MSDSVDFKKLWAKPQIEMPKTSDLYKKADRLRRNQILKIGFLFLITILTTVFIASIWYTFQPKLFVTKIGMIAVILAMWIFIANYSSTLPFLKSNIEVDSKSYLQQLIKLKEKQLILQTTMLNIYFAMLGIGLCLSIYEFLLNTSWINIALIYGLMVIWIVLNWFYFRPIILKKQQLKINNLIEKFKLLNNQLR